MPDLLRQPNLPSTDAGAWHSRAFWLAVVLTGLAAGLLGGALMRLLFAVEHWAWQYHTGHLLEGASHTAPERRMSMLLLAGVLVGVGNWLLARTVGKATDVDGAIWSRFGNVPVLATLAQSVQSIVAVGLGMSLGREAPIKHAGGAMACGVARFTKLSPEQQRVLVACGVGAGMAAAYNVPLGGALFAVEVLLGTMALELIVPALLASAVATCASWTMLPADPIYRIQEFPLSGSLVVWSILAGPVFGMAAVFLIRWSHWAKGRHPQGWRAVVAPLVVLGLLGVAVIQFPQLLGNGKDVVQLALDDAVSVDLLALLPVLKLVALTACLACGAHGGLFTPAMMIGALLGGLLGHAWQTVMPGASLGCCAVTGACAFLAASSQGPISSVVLTLELTRQIDATMVPILLAVCGAVTAVRRVESRSIYSP